MKQPTQPIAVRRSPVFVPGQGWVYTPGATMATSPPNEVTSSASIFIIGADTQSGGGTTSSFANTGDHGNTSLITITFSNIPSYTVPTGYQARLLVAIQAPPIPYTANSDYVIPTGINVVPLANTAGGRQISASAVGAGITVSSWETNVEIFYYVLVGTGIPHTASMGVILTALLVAVPA